MEQLAAEDSGRYKCTPKQVNFAEALILYC